jgi:hypothetical protein
MFLDVAINELIIWGFALSKNGSEGMVYDTFGIYTKRIIVLQLFLLNSCIACLWYIYQRQAMQEWARKSEAGMPPFFDGVNC